MDGAATLPLPWWASHSLANTLGIVSALVFSVQYLPQAYLNYQRRSVKGFSRSGIVIKYIGACFLLINASVIQEALPVILYGLVNVAQHGTFILQFEAFKPPDDKTPFLPWLALPVLPVALWLVAPWTVPLTNGIKPLSQIISHLPQLRESITLRTTHGVSLLTQHLNLCGGLCGLYMCLVVPPVSWMTYLLYVNSVLQALSIYTLAFWFDGWPFKSRPYSEPFHFFTVRSAAPPVPTLPLPA